VKQLVLDLIPAPTPTFDNFVPGKNREALDALRDAVRASAPARVLYFWGVPGSGKTHLLRAVSGLAGTSLLSQDDVAQRASDDAGQLRIAVDDVTHFTDAAQVGLFNLINRTLQADGLSWIAVSGSAAPRDLSLRPELSSRLGSGLVFQLHPLTDEEKSDALRAHAKARGFALREDVIAYLLRHARRDLASLISFLDALDRYSLETGREITLPLLREMAQPTLVQ
jgi:DnaA family protein